MKRRVIATWVIALAPMACKVANNNSDELAAKTVEGGNSTYVWLHGSSTETLVKDANGNLASADPGHTVVCGYVKSVVGASDLSPEEMQQEFSQASAFKGPNGEARYVDYSDLISAIQRRISNRADAAASATIDAESWRAAQDSQRQLGILSQSIQSIWRTPLGPKNPATPKFETVYQREKKGEKFCRGAFGIGENKACMAAYKDAKVKYKTATEAYIGFMKKIKSETRVPACSVPSPTDLADAFDDCNSQPTLQFLTEASRQKSAAEYENVYKVYRSVRAFMDSTNVGPNSAKTVINGKLIHQEKHPDGYSTSTVLSSTLGGLVNAVEVPGVSQQGLNDIREEFQNAISRSGSSTCPEVASLIQSGLWFHYNRKTNLAPVPVVANDPLAWIPTTPRTLVTVGNPDSRVTCQVPSTGLRAQAQGEVSFYDKTARIVLRDRRFFICGFEQGIPLDAGTVLTVRMADFTNNRPEDPKNIAPACSNGQECPGTPRR
jgi:hypothetical protein